jgi:3-deoxy-D-manno-octulosonic-acid transferase
VHPTDLTYAVAFRLGHAALSLAAPFSPKLRRGWAGRRETLPSLRAWAAVAREPDRPLIWLHAPSVGEGMMAQAILEEVRARLPCAQFIFTHFSPSAERTAARVGADWFGYLPWDRARDIDAALALAQPAAVAFVRTEIWPVLVQRAQSRGARVVLVNAVLADSSSRLRPAARALLGRAYRALDAVGVVNQDDAARFARLGVAGSRVQITGDARFDQVWRYSHRIDRDRPLLRLFHEGGPWLVAGSTWPADEERLVRALIAARAGGAAWHTIVAPHEPTDAHLRQLERRVHAAGFRYARLPAEGATALPEATDLVIVDRVGVLADLYSVAAVAYVGGGFGNAGLHSVVEPASLGVPVVLGPRHGNAQEANRLAAAGGAFVVRNGEELQDALRRLRRDTLVRERAGAAARDFVSSHTGGAQRSAALLVDGLPRCD